MAITGGNLGGLVKDTRKALSMTQSGLARKAGCSQRLVSDLENGKGGVEFGKVVAVLGALGLELRAVPIPSADPGGDVNRLAEGVAERLVAHKGRAPRLVDFLGEGR